MKIVLLFALLYLCSAAQGFCCKKGSAAVNNTASLAGFSAFQYCICAALMLLVVRPTSLPSDSLLLGLSFAAGCSMYISSLCTFCVVHMGTPIYWTTLMSSIGILIPIISSVFLFSETIHPIQVLGIALLFYGTSLAVALPHTEKAHISAETVLLLVAIFIVEGTTMLSQKCFAAFMPESDPSMFSLLAFAIAAIMTSVTYFILRLHTPRRQPAGGLWRLSAYGVVQSVALLAIMMLSTLTASLIPAVIQFSLQAGGSLIVSVMVSALAFHQTPTRKNRIGIALCIVALIIVNSF